MEGCGSLGVGEGMLTVYWVLREKQELVTRRYRARNDVLLG